ncbi:TetR/AcrR family transcriptional regulator [Pseudonocardia nigra]|uniref:TetR/AcrR family transcriptional regulator n=1 Tax=Pseudonocardia nigra TaxID=1921578 RepID=UPI001C5DBB25|nr:TetR/AcrR family transcriptional regulator [Pseudonocardia nigra]
MSAGSPDTRTRRPGGRTARLRALVLDAVLAELVDRGFEGLTVDGVAARSGVHRTTIYRRWTDIAGLLVDALHAAAGDDWAPPDTGSLEADLVELNRQVHTSLTVQPSVAAAVIAASFRSPQAMAALRAFWSDRYVRCAAIVERAVERGELPAGTDPTAVVVASTAPVYHHLVLLGDEMGTAEADAYARSAAAAYR